MPHNVTVSSTGCLFIWLCFCNFCTCLIFGDIQKFSQIRFPTTSDHPLSIGQWSAQWLRLLLYTERLMHRIDRSNCPLMMLLLCPMAWLSFDPFQDNRMDRSNLSLNSQILVPFKAKMSLYEDTYIYIYTY